MAIAIAGRHFHSAQAARIRADSIRTAVLLNGLYKNRDDYDRASAQFPHEVKIFLKAHGLCARNTSSVRT